MNEMIKARMFYEKKGRAKFISHLDVNRLMQRILKRTKLPVWYTEGFNPHMYLTFALPLSLGYESEYECMDFRLTKEIDFVQVCTILRQNMPEGFTVTKVASPIAKPAEIYAADYEIVITSPNNANQLTSAWSQFWTSDSIEVTKRTKRGEKTVDIKPDIALLSLDEVADKLVLKMRFPAGAEKSYNPSLLLDALSDKTEILMNYTVIRKTILKSDGSLFE